MKRKLFFVVLILPLTSLACVAQSIQPTLTALPPTPTVEPTLTTPTLATPTAAPVETATEPPPTAARSTEVEPIAPTDTVQPVTITPSPEQPGIMAFYIVPDQVRPGDTIMLTWSAAGESAQICPGTAQYEFFSEADCMDVPLEGSMEFVIPAELNDSYRQVKFILKIGFGSTPSIVEESVSTTLICDREWFFDADTALVGCPLEAITTNATMQYFEHGRMFWLEQPGRYLILYRGEGGESYENWYLSIYDPLDIFQDTSGDITAPEGLIAPSSGFGYVWRGDVDGVDGFRDSLGWATTPEEGYQATFQCDNKAPSGGRSWQSCYLSTPDGQVIRLMPDGWWMVYGQP
jgi:hypothetical protein